MPAVRESPSGNMRFGTSLCKELCCTGCDWQGDHKGLDDFCVLIPNPKKSLCCFLYWSQELHLNWSSLPPEVIATFTHTYAWTDSGRGIRKKDDIQAWNMYKESTLYLWFPGFQWHITLLWRFCCFLLGVGLGGGSCQMLVSDHLW